MKSDEPDIMIGEVYRSVQRIEASVMMIEQHLAALNNKIAQHDTSIALLHAVNPSRTAAKWGAGLGSFFGALMAGLAWLFHRP